MWLKQPPAPRPADAALGASSAPAPAQPELHAPLRVVRAHSATELPPGSPADPGSPRSLSSPGLARTLSASLLDRPTFFFPGFQGETGRLRREERSCGGRPCLEKVACPTPGGGGVGGRGKTMPRLRRGRRRQQARQAGCWGAGRQPRGAHRSEAPAFASRSSDAAGDRARFQQPPSPPPGGPSKSLDLGEGAVLRGITSGAGRRPENP